MENESLGKRIMNHRKRLGMTQETLAAKVGVSAQAVSKWENDLSCPDINILPELADIFGISVDELLGKETPSQVHRAEPIGDEEDQNKKHSFSFHYESPKWCGIWFAVYILCVGGLLLLNSVLALGVSWWTVLWTTALLVGGIAGLVHKLSFFSLGVALAGAYFLLTEFSVLRLDLGWSIVIPAFLLLWGASLLVDVLCGKRKKGKHVKVSDRTPVSECSCVDGHFHCEMAFGTHHEAVEMPLLRGGEIESSFGDHTVDFSGCKAVAGECTVTVENSFGELKILVPKRFAVAGQRRDMSFGVIRVTGDPNASVEGTIKFEVESSFGDVNFIYT